MPFFALAAQDIPPPPPPPAEAPAATPGGEPPQETATEEPVRIDEVIVVTQRPAVLNQIDRRIYDVGQTPAAQIMPALELLEKIPSVSVDPAGRVRLLGQSGVSILIDGQRPVNEQATLRSLTGAEIDRIEVMTNPGVQYGPAGSGGIINIITRRRTQIGLSGTLAATADTFGSVQASASPSITIGRWTINGSVNLASQTPEERSRLVRNLLSPPAAAASRIDETWFGETDQTSVSGRLRAEFRLSDSRRFSLGIEGYRSHQVSSRTGRAISAGPLPLDSLETGLEDSRYDSGALTASYSRVGPRDGEELTIAGRMDLADGQSENQYASADDGDPLSATAFQTFRRTESDNQSFKLDYKRPLGDERLLTGGVSWERNGEGLTYRRDIWQSPSGPSFETRRLDSERMVFGLYATLQVRAGETTVLPGLRLEHQDLEIASGGAEGSNRSFDLYPSLHIRRPLGEGLRVDLSYARRIDRPTASLLDPALTYSRALEANRGNPELRPQNIDSFEARFDFMRPRYSISATLYDRERSDLWTIVRERGNDGLIVSFPINAGDGADRGVELSFRGRLGERFNYVFTTNAFASTRRVLEGSGTQDRTSFRYLGNGQLEYVAPGQGVLAGDRVQLSVTYAGPERTYQTEYEPTVSANLTWTRPLTPRVSAVVTVRNLFNNSGARWSTYDDSFTEEARFDNRGVQVRLGLTYQLGALP